MSQELVTFAEDFNFDGLSWCEVEECSFEIGAIDDGDSADTADDITALNTAGFSWAAWCDVFNKESAIGCGFDV